MFLQFRNYISSIWNYISPIPKRGGSFRLKTGLAVIGQSFSTNFEHFNEIQMVEKSKLKDQRKKSIYICDQQNTTQNLEMGFSVCLAPNISLCCGSFVEYSNIVI